MMRADSEQFIRTVLWLHEQFGEYPVLIGCQSGFDRPAVTFREPTPVRDLLSDDLDAVKEHEIALTRYLGASSAWCCRLKGSLGSREFMPLDLQPATTTTVLLAPVSAGTIVLYAPAGDRAFGAAVPTDSFTHHTNLTIPLTGLSEEFAKHTGMKRVQKFASIYALRRAPTEYTHERRWVRPLQGGAADPLGVVQYLLRDVDTLKPGWATWTAGEYTNAESYEAACAHIEKVWRIRRRYGELWK